MRGPVTDSCHVPQQVIYLVFKELPCEPRVGGDKMCMFGVECVGKASDRVLLDLSQWELAW